MEQPEKSLVKAYVLLVLFGCVGAHRFYLKRPGTGLMMALLTIACGALITYGTMQEDQEIVYTGYFVGALCVSVMIVDLMSIPTWVDTINGVEDETRMAVIAGNLDPSFQATMRHAGRDDDPDAPRRSAIPDDYDRPWKRDNQETETYKPGQD